MYMCLWEEDSDKKRHDGVARLMGLSNNVWSERERVWEENRRKRESERQRDREGAR